MSPLLLSTASVVELTGIPERTLRRMMAETDEAGILAPWIKTGRHGCRWYFDRFEAWARELEQWRRSRRGATRGRSAGTGSAETCLAAGTVRAVVFEGRSQHAFRKCFTSALKRLGADDEAVEHLVGHVVPGSRARYLDPDALPLRSAVALIPKIVRRLKAGSSEVVVPLKMRSRLA